MHDVAASFTNSETGMTAFVFRVNGKFNVSLRDDDSGEFVPIYFTGYEDLASAEAKAKKIADV